MGPLSPSLPLSLSLSLCIVPILRSLQTKEGEIGKEKRRRRRRGGRILQPQPQLQREKKILKSQYVHPHWWMGNCISFRRVVSWVDDGEWDFLEDESPRHSPQPPKFQEHVQQQSATSTDSTDTDSNEKQTAEVLSTVPIKSTHEVRIKITKKQLAELLRQAENKGLPVQDVLASLLETRKPHRVKHNIGQCWRPALQSIPEIVD